MYFKVMKDGVLIDVLDKLIYAKWQDKNKIMVCCDEAQAQAILSSDGTDIWHVAGLYDIPVKGFDTVELHRCNVYEYRQLKALSLKTPQQILDAYTLELLEGGVL